MDGGREDMKLAENRARWGNIQVKERRTIVISSSSARYFTGYMEARFHQLFLGPEDFTNSSRSFSNKHTNCLITWSLSGGKNKSDDTKPDFNCLT